MANVQYLATMILDLPNVLNKHELDLYDAMYI